MSRSINIAVTGCYAVADARTAGTQGEGGVTTLHFTLDQAWAGLGKRVIWRDAAAGNPVVTVLFDPTGTGDTLTYDVRIPAEPLALPGWMSATLEGYTLSEEGTVSVARTVEIRLQVLMNDGFYAPAEPAASELAQIYDRLGAAEQNLLDYVSTCMDAAETCTDKRQLIEDYAALSRTYAERALAAADAVEGTAGELEAVEGEMALLRAALTAKLSANLGAEHQGLFLVIDGEGNVVPGSADTAGTVTSVAGRTGAVTLTSDDIADLLYGDTLTMALRTLHNSKPDRVQPDHGGKLWAMDETGTLCFVEPARSAAVTAVDLSGWDSGSFTVTRDGGVTEEYVVTFDDDSRPVTITDGGGCVTVITWEAAE